RGNAHEVESAGGDVPAGDGDRLHRLVDRGRADGLELRRPFLPHDACKRARNGGWVRLGGDFEDVHGWVPPRRSGRQFPASTAGAIPFVGVLENPPPPVPPPPVPSE